MLGVAEDTSRWAAINHSVKIPASMLREVQMPADLAQSVYGAVHQTLDTSMASSLPPWTNDSSQSSTLGTTLRGPPVGYGDAERRWVRKMQELCHLEGLGTRASLDIQGRVENVLKGDVQPSYSSALYSRHQPELEGMEESPELKSYLCGVLADLNREAFADADPDYTPLSMRENAPATKTRRSHPTTSVPQESKRAEEFIPRAFGPKTRVLPQGTIRKQVGLAESRGEELYAETPQHGGIKPILDPQQLCPASRPATDEEDAQQAAAIEGMAKSETAEMEALCERLHGLVAAAKDLARQADSPTKPDTALPPPAAAAPPSLAGHPALAPKPLGASAEVEPLPLPSAGAVLHAAQPGSVWQPGGATVQRVRESGEPLEAEAGGEGRRPGEAAAGVEGGRRKRKSEEGIRVYRSGTEGGQVEGGGGQSGWLKELLEEPGGGKAAGAAGKVTGKKVKASSSARGSAHGQRARNPMLAIVCNKLASRWNDVQSMFAEFDRPGMDGEADQGITQREFRKGLRDLKFHFTAEEIRQMFEAVDLNQDGVIDMAEFEAVLEEYGALSAIAVKKVPKGTRLGTAVEAVEEEEEGGGQELGKESPVTPKRRARSPPKEQPGTTAVLAEELAQLEGKIKGARRAVEAMEAACEEFAAIEAQWEKAGGAAEAAGAREVLARAGEQVVARLEEGAQKFKASHAPLQQLAMGMIQKLPADYRVVWKAAFCAEIDGKIAEVRGLAGRVAEVEGRLRGLRAQCRQWRAACRNPALELATRPAGAVEVRGEGYTAMLRASQQWMKAAIDGGLADEQQVLSVLGRAGGGGGGRGGESDREVRRLTAQLAKGLAEAGAPGGEGGQGLGGQVAVREHIGEPRTAQAADAGEGSAVTAAGLAAATATDRVLHATPGRRRGGDGERGRVEQRVWELLGGQLDYGALHAHLRAAQDLRAGIQAEGAVPGGELGSGLDGGEGAWGDGAGEVARRMRDAAMEVRAEVAQAHALAHPKPTAALLAPSHKPPSAAAATPAAGAGRPGLRGGKQEGGKGEGRAPPALAFGRRVPPPTKKKAPAAVAAPPVVPGGSHGAMHSRPVAAGVARAAVEGGGGGVAGQRSREEAAGGWRGRGARGGLLVSRSTKAEGEDGGGGGGGGGTAGLGGGREHAPGRGGGAGGAGVRGGEIRGAHPDDGVVPVGARALLGRPRKAERAEVPEEAGEEVEAGVTAQEAAAGSGGAEAGEGRGWGAREERDHAEVPAEEAGVAAQAEEGPAGGAGAEGGREREGITPETVSSARAALRKTGVELEGVPKETVRPGHAWAVSKAEAAGGGEAEEREEAGRAEEGAGETEQVVLLGVDSSAWTQRAAGGGGEAAERGLAAVLAGVLGMPAASVRVQESMAHADDGAGGGGVVEILVTLAAAAEQSEGLMRELQAQGGNPQSPLWATEGLRSVTVAGDTFERVRDMGSPPREERMEEAGAAGTSPQLAAGEWEEVRASKDHAVGVGGEGAFGLSPGRLRHVEKPSKLLKIPTVEMTEKSLLKFVLAYVEHHACARVLIEAAKRPNLWTGVGPAGAVENSDRGQHDSKTMSVAASRLLGAEGMGLLMHSGQDVEDSEVLSVAADALLAECKTVLKRTQEGQSSEGDEQAGSSGMLRRGVREEETERRAAEEAGAARESRPEWIGGRSDEAEAVERLVLSLVAEHLFKACQGTDPAQPARSDQDAGEGAALAEGDAVGDGGAPGEIGSDELAAGILAAGEGRGGDDGDIDSAGAVGSDPRDGPGRRRGPLSGLEAETRLHDEEYGVPAARRSGSPAARGAEGQGAAAEGGSEEEEGGGGGEGQDPGGVAQRLRGPLSGLEAETRLHDEEYALVAGRPGRRARQAGAARAGGREGGGQEHQEAVEHSLLRIAEAMDTLTTLTRTLATRETPPPQPHPAAPVPSPQPPHPSTPPPHTTHPATPTQGAGRQGRLAPPPGESEERALGGASGGGAAAGAGGDGGVDAWFWGKRSSSPAPQEPQSGPASARRPAWEEDSEEEAEGGAGAGAGSWFWGTTPASGAAGAPGAPAAAAEAELEHGRAAADPPQPASPAVQPPSVAAAVAGPAQGSAADGEGQAEAPPPSPAPAPAPVPAAVQPGSPAGGVGVGAASTTVDRGTSPVEALPSATTAPVATALEAGEAGVTQRGLVEEATQTGQAVSSVAQQTSPSTEAAAGAGARQERGVQGAGGGEDGDASVTGPEETPGRSASTTDATTTTGGIAECDFTPRFSGGSSSPEWTPVQVSEGSEAAARIDESGWEVEGGSSPERRRADRTAQTGEGEEMVPEGGGGFGGRRGERRGGGRYGEGGRGEEVRRERGSGGGGRGRGSGMQRWRKAKGDVERRAGSGGRWSEEYEDGRMVEAWVRATMPVHDAEVQAGGAWEPGPQGGAGSEALQTSEEGSGSSCPSAGDASLSLSEGELGGVPYAGRRRIAIERFPRTIDYEKAQEPIAEGAMPRLASSARSLGSDGSDGGDEEGGSDRESGGLSDGELAAPALSSMRGEAGGRQRPEVASMELGSETSDMMEEGEIRLSALGVGGIFRR